MKTTIISIYHPKAISLAIATLENGGLIAFPTDTVYGLAAPISDFDSINQLYEVKSRDSIKAIPIMVGSYDQLSSVASSISPAAQRLINHLWPGALTVIVQKKPGLPTNLSSSSTIGVRMPNYLFALKLLKETGALAVTSANLSGKENPQTSSDVNRHLGGKIQLILDGGPTPNSIPSTVVDCSTTEIKILRQGAISLSQIQACL